MQIWWIRRDLRLADNPALQAAISAGNGVIPVYILDPHTAQRAPAKRRSFLLSGLHALDADLRSRGSRLIVRDGMPNDALATLLAETGADGIIAEEGYGPYARRRDADVAASLPLRLTSGRTLRHPEDVLTRAGSPYTVYTPFMRAWKAQPLPDERDALATPARLPTVPPDLASASLPPADDLPGFPAGEAEAQRRLHAFAADDGAPICSYTSGRDQLAEDGTSQLSPYLRFGMISARQAVIAACSATCGRGASGAETWLNELIWREFYQSILFHFPGVLTDAMRTNLRDICWQNDPNDYAAWCEGHTGIPVVDAGMRQLVQTGWMHNRARMIAASFLVKDLLVDWRWGERFFMQHLIDGDAAANNGGWQWTAGVGADAAPYFRIFNPLLQGQRFDAAGVYVRRWVPELAGVPHEFIHMPWAMPVAMQRAAGCVIGIHYPAPVVDREMARRRALAAYRQARAQ